MSDNKYLALKAAFRERNLCSGDQLQCWMEDAKIIPDTIRVGDGLEVCSVQYEAIFKFENPKAKPETIFTHLVFWLNENDDERSEQQLPAPEFDVERLGKGKVVVELSVKFREAIQVVEDEDGEFIYKGKRYRLDTPVLDVADTASVEGDKPHTREF